MYSWKNIGKDRMPSHTKNAGSTKRALSPSQGRSMYERTGMEKHTSPANAITDQQKSSSVKDKFTLTELLFCLV